MCMSIEILPIIVLYFKLNLVSLLSSIINCAVNKIIIEKVTSFFSKWLARPHTGVLDNRLVRRHTGVQVYSNIYLERRYAVPEHGT